MYSSKYFNSDYIEFYYYYATYEKLIRTSDEGSRNTNKTIRQGIPKTHTNKVSYTSSLGFGYSPNNDTCYILSEDLVLSIIQAYYQKMDCIGLYKEG